MGHRLSKIYTRTGDAGTTGLGDGSRTSKDSARVAAMGDVDELNSLIGVILCEDLPTEVRELFIGVQHDLFDLGGEMSIPGATLLKATQPARLEAAIDRYNADLGPLKEFILPGGNRAAALTHLARTVCRRAERLLAALARAEPVGAWALPYLNRLSDVLFALAAEGPVSDAGRQYLNRLSDLLFVLGRWLNKAAGGSDVLWQKGRNA
jgi:cob(I)alamin adenosyltransferase